jgi:hypothetical protein
MQHQSENITPPIIVIGMHRSGTTLLTRMLELCGMFWGALPDEYNESAFFQFSNEALFAMASATWDAPALMEHFLSHPDNQKKGSDFLQKRLKEDFCSEYCCGLRTNRTFQTDLLPTHWGWKDPRNVYTLGLWLKQFPNAGVIHIIRSGIDVALSLWQRETSRPEGTDHPHYSHLCQNLTGCFGLWNSYVRKARKWADSVERYLEIRFEALITAPLVTLNRLVRFIGLTPDNQVTVAVDLAQPKSPLVCSRDSHLKDFIKRARNNDLMQTLGYPPQS